jgi:hypothetical protein
LLGLLLLCRPALAAQPASSPPPLAALYRQLGQDLRFVKVPKTASTSVQVDIRAAGLDAGGTGEGENCYSDLFSGFKASRFNFVYLRHPREQVLSFFVECKYAGWAKKRTSAEFPRNDTDVVGFEKWVAYFSDWQINQTRLALSAKPGNSWMWLNDMNCYNPRDLVTRQLSSRANCVRMPHHIYSNCWPPKDDFLSAALTHLPTFNFVGSADLFQLSWCLLSDRLGLEMPEGCFSDTGVASATLFVHGRNRPRAAELSASIPPDVWDRVDDLTRNDAAVYVAALRRLLGEAAAVQRARGGRGERRLARGLIDYERLRRTVAYLPQELLRGLPEAFDLGEV